MNGFTRTPRRIGAVRLLWLGPVVLGLGLGGSHRAEAAAIHHADKVVRGRRDRVQPDWSEYLLGGPSVWSTVAPSCRDAGDRTAMWKSIKTDPPPDTDASSSSAYKQSLDPTRFDHYHPKLAAALAKIEAETPTAATTPTTTTSSGTSTTTHRPGSTAHVRRARRLLAGLIAPIPEPDTLLLALGMAGWGIWWRRRRRLSSSRVEPSCSIIPPIRDRLADAIAGRRIVASLTTLYLRGSPRALLALVVD